MNKEEVTFKFGEETYKIRRPSNEEIRESKKVYNRAFSDAISSGAQLQIKINDLLKSQDLWDDSKDKTVDNLRKQINDNELILAKGGIKKLEAKEVALKIKDLRREVTELLAPISELGNHSAEGQASNARFDYLVSVCTVYNDGRACFSGYEDYVARNTEEFAVLAATKFADMYYGLTENFESSLPENQFLKEYGFVDDKLRLVNADKKLVDRNGNLVDEFGRRVNEKGELVNIYGNVIDENGNLKVEQKPFLD